VNEHGGFGGLKVEGGKVWRWEGLEVGRWEGGRWEGGKVEGLKVGRFEGGKAWRLGGGSRGRKV